MIDVAIVGLGKMGLSHLSIINAHPDVNLKGICDTTGYVLDVLEKYTGITGYKDLDEMLDTERPQALIVATPTHLHAKFVQAAFDRGIHVFCEKPFLLDPAEGVPLLAQAAERNLVTQVGYHNKFVAAFAEVKRLLDLDAIGPVSTVLAEAYGPVVLKEAGRTWRSDKALGGGCLYDYAAHPVDLLSWYLGAPDAVSGGSLTNIFSAQIDDAVTATFHYPGAAASLVVNWSDESQRKMTTKVTLYGKHGRIYADRQEIQVYLRDTAPIPEGYRAGWNVRYTTELTEETWFYLRGEEYSAQLDSFVQRVAAVQPRGLNEFASALQTDRMLMAIRQSSDAGGDRVSLDPANAVAAPTAATATAVPSRADEILDKAKDLALAGFGAARTAAGAAARKVSELIAARRKG